MTAKIGSALTAQVLQRLAGPAGINSSLAAFTQADRGLTSPLDAAQLREQNVAADLSERGGAVKYPAVNVYCERIKNEQTEKFRSFWGGF